MKKILIVVAVIFVIGVVGLVGFNKLRPRTPTIIDYVPTPTTEYTLADISSHSTETNCWMSIDGKVYNVTDYIPSHPDGRSILKGCGLDATVMFQKIKKHFPKALDLLPPYQIGILK